MTTTPDPITTAREALERLWKARDLFHPDSMIMHYDSVSAIFDLAEKLKAERDVLRKEANNAVKSAHGHAVNLNKIITAVLPRGPMCRDCADEDGTCPHNDGLPCDPYDEVIERFRRLTSQLEQAERVIAPLYFDSTNVPFAIPDRRPLWMRADNGKYVELLHTTAGTLRAASQWIKDRQDKTDGEPS